VSVAKKLALCTLTVCGVVIYLGHERIINLPSGPPPANTVAPPVAAPIEAPPTPVTSTESPTPVPGVSPVPDPATEPGAGNPAPPPVVEEPVDVLATGLPMKADRDGGFNGCKDGTLILSESELVFTCDSNAKRDVHLKVEEVQVTDKNGVKGNKGTYHFDIHGMDKEMSANLIDSWLKQVKSVSSAAIN
jgi:hypothetical protein